MADPAGCVVLVPVGSHVEPGCEDALRELERRGYPVRRVRGYSAIDAARSQMATDALRDGFEELMWVDSDIAFHPDAVEQLRRHGLPFVCGLYPKKNRAGFAGRFLGDTAKITFGADGGLHPILYAGFGFVLVRRPVFEAVRAHAQLPTCNTIFNYPLVPYFWPMVIPTDGGGSWYLSEDYAFCERARRAGMSPLADTTIRLIHIGSYGYSWDDLDQNLSG